ncbi:MAG: hypothetical protein JF616_22420 [Fibrobacteres bacterium]|nr:hypothetical protein [Fibrobacterota bacterium]
MKIWFCLAAILSLTGCYTQLYTGGYAERTVYPYPYDRDASPRDSVVADSLDSVAAADTLHHPKTVIVNNYYDNSPYYRGYSIDAWDYPAISLGFYSGRYRDYYGPYWWGDGHAGRRHYRQYYETYPGGGTTQGPYHSDRRIFPPASSQPPLHKGRRSEPAQPAAKPAAPAPAAPAQSTAPAESSRSSSSSDDGKSSSNSSSGSSGGSSNDQHDLHKGRR